MENRYIMLTIEGKPVPEHRYIMEQNLGRKLLGNELVHHINGIKNDNRIENLTIMTAHDHLSYHGKLKKGTKYKRHETREVTSNSGIFYSKLEIAKKLKISVVTIDRLRKKGLPSHQLGRKVVFDFNEVEKWIKEDK